MAHLVAFLWLYPKDWPAWITAVSTGVLAAATSVLAAAAIVALQSLSAAREGLEDARRTRHAQLITDLSRRWDEPLAKESRNLNGELGTSGIMVAVDRIYDPPHRWFRSSTVTRADLERFFKLCAWPNLIETIGVLVAEGAISPDVVFKMWGAGIVSAWEMWEEPITHMRTAEAKRGIYRQFETVADEMRLLLNAEAAANAASARE